MKPIELLLPRLGRVFQTGPRDWNARCPAHLDKSPSLHVTEREDGTLLLHCRGGCRTFDILEAIGLSWKHLFPRGRPRQMPSAKPAKFRVSDEAMRSVIREHLHTAGLHRALVRSEATHANAYVINQMNTDWIAAYDKRLLECQT